VTAPVRPQRPCPVCGGRRHRKLFRQAFAAVSGATLLEGYDVVLCEDCGCGFADDLPEQSAFDAYYQDLSKYEASQRSGENPSFEQGRAAAIAAFIGRYVPSPDAHILEIGCATGRLLWELRSLGFQHVSGVDPSPSCAETAATEFGVPVRTGTLAALPNGLDTAQMLVVIGVLEHVRDLEPALESVRELLTFHGRMYVEVPDVTGFARWLDAPFQQFSSEHINYFSTASLSALLGRHGFRPVIVERLARPVTETSTMPVIAAVFEYSGRATGPSGKDEVTEQALLEYIEASRALEARRPDVIERLVRSGEPIVVWGVGTHTTRLLESTSLRDANIVAFIDSNPKLQGKTLLGRSVLPPSELRRLEQPVLISSRVFQDEIERQIRDELGCSNRILRLYSD
jgi:SAM-dependent methyltransferase